jgi:hypothetical protein
MLRFRRVPATLGVLGVVAAAACLVFDGRVATDSGEAGPSDGSGKPDGAEVDVQAMDAPGAPEVAARGVVCSADAGVSCPGGASQKCCAKGGGPDATPWTYPTTPDRCSKDCYALGGFGGYACDDDTDCPHGAVCCGFRSAGSPPQPKKPPPFNMSACVTACAPPGRELCQPAAKPSCTCVPADPEYLPPHFHVCADD